MTLLSTFFQRSDAEFSSTKPTAGYSHININLQKKRQTSSTTYLNWTPNPEVVLFPQSTFYIRDGKRLIDILLSGIVFISVLSWLIPLISVLILIESKGPVFFIQTRSGLKGKPFLCLKFRTMRHVSQPYNEFRQTSYNDSRVTVLGKFLRKTNLDEMPQFINVLFGEMSIVGPRPHAISHDALHWPSSAYRERYWVKPGITGLAQIRGSRGATGANQRMEHRVRYDHLYISNQSLWLDLKICYATLKLMFKGDKNAW